MSKSCARLVAFVFGLATTGFADAADVAVMSCGQSYSGDGYLTADLDCTGTTAPAVTINQGALDLRGFTLTGGTDVAVRCEDTCTIDSEPAGGTVAASPSGRAAIESGCGGVKGVTTISISSVVVAGGSEYAIGWSYIPSCPVGRKLRLTVADSEVVGSGGNGIRYPGRVTLLRSVVSGHGGSGIFEGARVTATDAMLLDNGGWGASGANIRLRGSTVSGNDGGGVRGGRANIRESTVANNGSYGVTALFDPVKVTDSVVMANEDTGVVGCGVTIRRSSITGNGGDGAVTTYCPRDAATRIFDSVVTGNARNGIGGVGSFCYRYNVVLNGTQAAGNGGHPDCGVTETCADVVACRTPHVTSGSTCERSYDVESGFPGTNFGVCSLD